MVFSFLFLNSFLFRFSSLTRQTRMWFCCWCQVWELKKVMADPHIVLVLTASQHFHPEFLCGSLFFSGEGSNSLLCLGKLVDWEKNLEFVSNSEGWRSSPHSSVPNSPVQGPPDFWYFWNYWDLSIVRDVFSSWLAMPQRMFGGCWVHKST